MSSWITNPWSIFCDPHWELICCNKSHPGTLEIFTPPKIAVGTQFHVSHGTKTISVFLPADGEASSKLLPSSVYSLPGGSLQPENIYSCILKVTGQFWESQKRISINTSHSYHLRSSPCAGLNWSIIKIRFSFNPLTRKRWGARVVSVIKLLLHKLFLLWYHH